MSDTRRDEKRKADDAYAKASDASPGGPDLDCSETTDLLVMFHLDEDAFADRPGLRQAIESHIEICTSCRMASDSVKSAMVAMKPSQRAIEEAWEVLKAEAARGQQARS